MYPGSSHYNRISMYPGSWIQPLEPRPCILDPGTGAYIVSAGLGNSISSRSNRIPYPPGPFRTLSINFFFLVTGAGRGAATGRDRSARGREPGCEGLGGAIGLVRYLTTGPWVHG